MSADSGGFIGTCSWVFIIAGALVWLYVIYRLVLGQGATTGSQGEDSLPPETPCPYCGRGNPPSSTKCLWCGRLLLAPEVGDIPQDNSSSSG
ncbi:MAG TPA: hypothetical protein VM409_07210 [Chloroflexia bacterium]|nr:hypothetical protein [Chloroflexia bacterium]